jgi:hypothetical protein
MIQTAAYTEIGTRVVNRVANDGELFPDVARKGDTEVELSRAEPTLGSLLVFWQGCQLTLGSSAWRRQGPSVRSRPRSEKIARTCEKMRGDGTHQLPP